MSQGRDTLEVMITSQDGEPLIDDDGNESGAVESAAKARAEEAEKWADISRSADFPDGE
jgi:hypothetical protein